MTVTSQRPLKILIRYKKRSLSSISLFLKVKWPSDSIKSGQLPTKCFGFGKYLLYTPLHCRYSSCDKEDAFAMLCRRGRYRPVPKAIPLCK